MPVYLTNAHLEATEAITIANFAAKVPGVDSHMALYIDALLAVSHVIGGAPATSDGFDYFAWERFVLSPYTFRSVWQIGRRGYYSEATTLLRHLLEVFVQVRYFEKHKDKLQAHLDPTTKKGKVHFKTMFEAVSPGYYDRHYALNSAVAHGGMGHSLIGGMTFDKEKLKVHPPMGLVYNEWKSSIVVNQMLMLMSGFLIQVPAWFPHYLSVAPPLVEGMRSSAQSELMVWRNGHRLNHPKGKEWHERCDLLMGTA